MDMQRAELILDLVASVPPGKVATYGDIAAMANCRSPRLVGRILADLSDDATPWHRIIRSDGRPASHHLHEQYERLRSEGVLARNGRIDLHRYRWQPFGPG